MTAVLEGGWVVSSTPRPHFTPGKDPVPILQEAGWAPGPVWTGAEKSRPHRDSIPDRPARRQSLYRLSYPAHLRNVSVTICNLSSRISSARAQFEEMSNTSEILGVYKMSTEKLLAGLSCKNKYNIKMGVKINWSAIWSYVLCPVLKFLNLRRNHYYYGQQIKKH